MNHQLQYVEIYTIKYTDNEYPQKLLKNVIPVPFYVHGEKTSVTAATGSRILTQYCKSVILYIVLWHRPPKLYFLRRFMFSYYFRKQGK